MASRFARPDTDTLTLANGDTLTVKRRLNAGDDRARRGMASFPTLEPVALVVAYLIDWHLTEDGAPAIKGLSTKDLINILDNLDAAAFDELHAAIAVHVEAMQAERDAEKNAKAGTRSDAAISASASAPAGPLTTSAA